MNKIVLSIFWILGYMTAFLLNDYSGLSWLTLVISVVSIYAVGGER